MDRTSEEIHEEATGNSLIVTQQFDSVHYVTNTAVGYCSTPSNWWSMSWDTNSHVMTQIVDPESAKTTFDYTNGSVSAVHLFYDSSNSYDTTYTYLTNGLLSAVTNANGSWMRYQYDSYGFPTSVVPKTGPAVRMKFSSLGHLTRIEMPPHRYQSADPPGANGAWTWRTTEFDVDSMGRVQEITYPNDQTETFQYDALGHLTNHVDIAGRTNRFTYAPGGHLSSATRTLVGAASNTAVTISTTYDNQLNTLSISDPLDRIVEAYKLDVQERPIAVTNVEDQTMNIVYAVGDYVDHIERFDGTTVRFDYNGDGLLDEACYPDATNTFTYLKNGLASTAVNALGTVSNRYNPANRLESSSGTAPSSTVSYVYFPAGQVSNVTSVAGTTTYALDGADRVYTISAPAGTFQYTYNTNNGMVETMTCTNTGVAVEYQHDELDRLKSITWFDASTNVIRSFDYQFTDAGMIETLARESG